MIAASPDVLAQLPLADACAALEVGRGSYYRQGVASGRSPREPANEEVTLLAAIEQVVLAFPGYGYPRVTRHLQREGFAVNHKRVYRLMREAGLLHERGASGGKSGRQTANTAGRSILTCCPRAAGAR